MNANTQRVTFVKVSKVRLSGCLMHYTQGDKPYTMGLNILEEGHGEYASSQRPPSYYSKSEIEKICRMTAEWTFNTYNKMIGRSVIFSFQSVTKDMKNWGVYISNRSKVLGSVTIFLPKLWGTDPTGFRVKGIEGICPYLWGRERREKKKLSFIDDAHRSKRVRNPKEPYPESGMPTAEELL